MSKHTPGPWEADRAKMDEGGHYYQIDGQQLVGNLPYTVADTLNRHFCISPDEDAANAHLIAAAPELLEALKDVLPLAIAYLKGAPTHPDNEKLSKAVAAIGKAEGRQ